MRLRFLLDPGAGGCLWPLDAETRRRLGDGPADAGVYGTDGSLMHPPSLPLPVTTTALRDALMQEHLAALEATGGPGLTDPVRFDADTDRLLSRLRQDLPGADIRDDQPRHVNPGG